MKRTGGANGVHSSTIDRQAHSLAALGSTRDEYVHAPASAPDGAEDSVIVSGDVLWTMTKGAGVAQAQRWHTPRGYELEVQVWTGPRVAGREDLSWAQVFTSLDALLEAAHAKKCMLQGIGWIEDLLASARPAAAE